MLCNVVIENASRIPLGANRDKIMDTYFSLTAGGVISTIATTAGAAKLKAERPDGWSVH
jgi:hypothetical protein